MEQCDKSQDNTEKVFVTYKIKTRKWVVIFEQKWDHD